MKTEGPPDSREAIEDYGLYSEQVQKAKERWSRLFDDPENKNSRDRVKKLLEQYRNILDDGRFYGREIRAGIEALSGEENKEKFIEGMMLALKPVIDLAKNQPKEFEKILRELQDSGESKRVNDVFYYDIHENQIVIHVSASKTLGGAKIGRLFQEGMKALVQVVKQNSSIEKISANSWVIFEMMKRDPKLVNKYLRGFQIIFMDEENKEALAEISAQDLVKEYQ